MDRLTSAFSRAPDVPLGSTFSSKCGGLSSAHYVAILRSTLRRLSDAVRWLLLIRRIVQARRPFGPAVLRFWRSVDAGLIRAGTAQIVV